MRSCEKAGIECRFKVTLTKNIPAGAGLGGGSSDAAAVMIGLNKLAKLGFSAEQLSEMAAQLGSDISFFFGGPLAICTGRGEKIKKIEQSYPFMAALILPNISSSTKKVYENYEHDLTLYTTLKNEIDEFLAKNRVDLIAQICANMLAKSCFTINTQLDELKAKVEKSGITPVCLSGSGSAMFHICEDTDCQNPKLYQRKLKEMLGCEVLLINNNNW